MEIKKAFEQFKKELKKETGICGGFTMSAKQIENRTATYCVCNMISYEDEIAYHKRACDRVRGYDSWTEEEKARFISNAEETIKYYEGQIARYGTKENYARETVARIVNSNAFKNLANTIGDVRYCTEIKTSSGLTLEHLRFYY